MKKIVIGISLVAAVVIAFLTFFVNKVPNKAEQHQDEQIVAEQTESTTEDIKDLGDALGESQPLKTIIEENLQEQAGDWAAYIEDLSTGSNFAVNNHKMVSASLIKLFIMGAIYQEVYANNLAMDDVDAYLEGMITISDNEASNILVSKLGNGTYTDMYAEDFQAGLIKMNDFAASIGCMDTEQQRDMKNFREIPVSEQNYTSVKDCGKLLSMMYSKKLVTEMFDEEMLMRMTRQTRRHKIPAGIPSSIKCANKTGELSDVENDVAIVYSPACDYIICVMANDLPDTNSAQKNIIKLSSLTYNYFNVINVVSH